MFLLPRTFAASSRFQPSKPYSSSLYYLLLPSTSSYKKMAGEGRSRERDLRARGSTRSRGSISVGKASSYQEDVPSLSVRRGNKQEGSHTVRRQQAEASSEGSSSSVVSVGKASSYQEDVPLLSVRWGNKQEGSHTVRRQQAESSSEGSSSTVGYVGKASSNQEDEPSVSVPTGDKQEGSQQAGASAERVVDNFSSRLSSTERVVDDISLRLSELHPEMELFDICKPQTVTSVQLNPSLFQKNKEKRRIQCSKVSAQHQRLRPGMILLRNYLSYSDQVEIIKQCQQLGLGSGGFYRPGYRDGAKLYLQMMCLGKNWDPQTRLYEERRPTDGAEPPNIPVHFKKLVEEAIQTSHAFLKQTKKHCSVEDDIPAMSPDLCIVNFYSISGRLGLHQDRDESEESLQKRLPVVSFSVGDSADFLYGESRDVDTAEKVMLESGDVLIFGGKSRHIFHGISYIHPNTAPRSLIDETALLPGRLNLTFRKY